MMLKDQLDQLKDRLNRKEFGREFVPLPTKSVIDLIEAHNDLYEALENCFNSLMCHIHNEYDGVYSDDDFSEIEAPYLAALAKARGEV